MKTAMCRKGSGKRIAALFTVTMLAVMLLCPAVCLAKKDKETPDCRLEPPKATAKKITELDVKDGIYTMPIYLQEGWFETNVIDEPARVRIKDGKMTALIHWDSKYVTQMKVNGEVIEPKKREGNSQFVIPVSVVDAPFEVGVTKTEFGTTSSTTFLVTLSTEKIKKASARKNPAFAAASAGAALLSLLGIGIVAVLMIRKRLQF